MSPSSSKRAVNRRARQNKSSGRTVVAISRSEQFAERMARSDRTTIKGKLLFFGVSLTTGVNNLLTVTPNNLGIRPAALAAIFSQYHINFIRVKFIDVNSSPFTNTTVLGFLDDASGSEGDAPTTTVGVLELRCSAVSMIGATIPTEFMYTQKASSFWLKTSAGASGSDPRLSVAAILFAGSAGASALTYELDFSITFQGAIDVSGV